MTEPIPPHFLEKLHAITDPYRAEAERLGFRFLEEIPRRSLDPTPGCWATMIFLYQHEGLFLDIHALVPESVMPRALLEGFNGIQIYTFVEEPHLNFVLTNGSPANRPRSLLGDLFDRAFPSSEEHRVIDVASPADLSEVIAAHRAKFRLRRRILIPPENDPLAQRWQWCDEMNISGDK